MLLKNSFDLHDEHNTIYQGMGIKYGISVHYSTYDGSVILAKSFYRFLSHFSSQKWRTRSG